MGNSTANTSCSSIDPSLPCSADSANHTEDCNMVPILAAYIFQADCYIEPFFYPLTVLLIVVGTILNSCSIYCFLKINKRDPQNIYLLVLSLGDTIGLHINFTLPMLRKLGKSDAFFSKSEILCRVTGVLTESFLIFPTWIVVLLTIERLIYISCPLQRRSLYTQKRIKLSIAILAIIVVLLSLYRLFDIKGIDQVSVFAVVACSVKDRSIPIMRNLNLMIWTILPEFLTLILSLIMVYKIKLAAQKFQPNYGKAHRSRYNQATKTVLLISILFLVFHTPTGIIIGLDLFYAGSEKILAIIIILVSRKLTITLYEINLCCKFFIYYHTVRNFKIILHKSLSGFTRRTNSAKLVRQDRAYTHCRPIHPAIHFYPKQSTTIPGSQSDSYTKTGDQYRHIFIQRNPRTGSTNLSRTNRGYQSIAYIIKTDQNSHASLQNTPNLLRRSSIDKRRSRWNSKAQITL